MVMNADGPQQLIKASTFSLLPDALTIIWVCEMSTTFARNTHQAEHSCRAPRLSIDGISAMPLDVGTHGYIMDLTTSAVFALFDDLFDRSVVAVTMVTLAQRDRA
jgi:hypothetical protein